MSETQKVNIEQRYCPTCYKQFEGLETCPQDGTTLRGPSNDPLIGKVFADRYDIESVLGLGGMSIVYKAKHRLMNRTVAIKMLHNKLKEDVVSLERFRLEAQAASMLSAGQQEVMAVLGRQFESSLIRTALKHTHGRKNDAAVRLGIGRNTITRKIAELGIDGAKDD
ncbi:MAG TPA: helix-turn-helix domain-containing protein [Candidatus Obscuribacter sp.]|nr:helix-turn-helix domain-containing protein [Candidatus Obscuribacter sp.]